MPYMMNDLEFQELQGCEFIRGKHETLFENGAWYNDVAYYDPSKDPIQLAKTRLAFYQIKHRRLVQEYNEIRDNVEDSARLAKQFPSTCMPPAPGWEKELQQRRAEIKKVQAKVQELEAERQQNDPHLARIAERQEELDQRSLKAYESLYEVSKFPRLPNS